MLSIITTEGELRYSLEANHIDGERYLEFLQQVLRAQVKRLSEICQQLADERHIPLDVQQRQDKLFEVRTLVLAYSLE